MTPLLIFIAIQIIGWLTAYPRNKKWTLEQKMASGREGDEWCYADAIKALISCFFLWMLVWAWYAFEKLHDIGMEEHRWWNKKSNW